MKKKKQQQEELIESHGERLIREKVEDMERRIGIGILDQANVNARYVHTYIDWRAGMPIEAVIDWFQRHRPSLITEEDKKPASSELVSNWRGSVNERFYCTHLSVLAADFDLTASFYDGLYYRK